MSPLTRTAAMRHLLVMLRMRLGKDSLTIRASYTQRA